MRTVGRTAGERLGDADDSNECERLTQEGLIICGTPLYRTTDPLEGCTSSIQGDCQLHLQLRLCQLHLQLSSIDLDGHGHGHTDVTVTHGAPAPARLPKRALSAVEIQHPSRRRPTS